MSSEVPGGWKETKLGDHCRVDIGGTPSRDKPQFWSNERDGHPWVSIADLKTPLVNRTKEFISDLGIANSNVKPVPRGTVMMSFKLTIGRTAIAGRDLFTNEAIAAFDPSDDLDNGFLFYALPHAAEGAETDQAIKGATLNKAKLRDLSILLPPLNEQRRIAEVLRSVDNQIDLTRRTLAATSAAKNAALIAILQSNSWPDVRVGDLLAPTQTPMRSGPFGSALLKSELAENGIPLLGIDNVQIERFIPEYRRFISDAKYQELARYTVFPNDVMVTIMGTVGRCCVVPQSIGCAISSKHVWTLTLDEQKYSPAFLAWQINHEPRVLDQLRGSAQGGIMSAISSQTLRNLRVPQPPHVRMLELDQLIISANSTLFRLEEELAGLTRLKRLVAGDLLSGRVRVPA